MSESYLPPVDRLLKLGAEPARRRTWPDYRTLGLEPRHVPALVRMATDPALFAAPERDPASWAPVHAWRALGQLEAPEAAGPLLHLLEARGEDFWVQEEVPDVLGMIGAAALPAATLLLFDEQRPEEMRMAAGAVITNVAFQHPDRRGEAAAVLVKQLEDWAHQSRAMNSYLVGELVALEETSAAPVMKAAFAAGAVDERACGTWREVQVALGLIAPPETPRTDEGWDGRREGSRTPSATAAAKASARRKAEKAARKRNRKKK